MKNFLFLVNSGKISSNENGGASVYYSHLELLFKAGYSVQLLVLEWDNQSLYNENDYKEITSFVKSIECYKITTKSFNKGIYRLVDAVLKPSEFEYNFLNKENFSFLHRIVEKNKVDVVWCEWRWATLLAIKAQLNVNVVYSHHDWEYKLALLRKKPTLLKRFHTFQKKRVELSIVKKSTACVSGSYTETNEIEKISSKKALYLPTTYNIIEVKNEKNRVLNIVHLGGMGTTANRIGLERFLDVCWEELKRKLPNIKLKVIGSLQQAQSSLLKKLEDTQIECVGFVKDLDTVLQPEDIHIVPWEYNTGTRTRIPVILNYGQVLVATKASVSCYPEITNENSILCDDLHQMTSEIINIYSDKERLYLLSTKGKKTFLNTFTVESQIQKIKNFIEIL